MENNSGSRQNGMSQQWNMSGQGNMSQGNDMAQQSNMSQQAYTIKDYGAVPVIFDMETMSKVNNTFRSALWTGTYMQLTVMSIQPGEDIGVEMHPDADQFFKIEEGDGLLAIGNSKDSLSFTQTVEDDDAIIIPAGTWHNLSNTGDVPLKLYSIYAPPQHPYGTVHQTKADSDEAEAKY